jgi:hypothetical protein
MKNLIFLVFAYLLLQNTTVFAHTGGHYHKGDNIVLDTWRLKSGEVVKGNFSFARDNKIFLEQEEGLIIPVSIEDLNIQDQKLANFRINKFSAVNTVTIDNNHYYDSDLNKYILLSILLISILVLITLKKPVFQNYTLNPTMRLASIGFLFMFSVFIACKKSPTSTPTSTSNPSVNPIEIVIPKTNTLFIDSAFTAFKPAISTNWDNTYFYISSNGIPNHKMMIGITNWQQQVPITQPYNGTNSWAIPLQPVYASVPLSTKTNLMKGAVAVAVNGIPIFNALNNRGEDSYKIGELDTWGGHCGKADDYHYHTAPLHLSTVNGLKPIAFALDGFPVYGVKEPDGSTMIELDSSHGHTGKNGIYHYHGTTDYPYVIGALKGKVTLDPATTAPENQVIPQAFTKPVRPATSPLSGAAITDFTAVGTNGYLLTYKIGSKNGSVKYSWDSNNKFTYILTDTEGNATTSSYQR